MQGVGDGVTFFGAQPAAGEQLKVVCRMTGEGDARIGSARIAVRVA